MDKYSQFIQPVALDSTLLDNANYILLDPFLFENVQQNLEDLGITCHLVAANLFEDAEQTPLLIDLSAISAEQKQLLWDEYGCNSSSSARSRFDLMSLCQNIITTDKTLDQMLDLLPELMRLEVNGEGYLLRYYDPRVSIHLNAILGSVLAAKPSIYHPYLLKFADVFKTWIVSIADAYYQLDFPNSELPLAKQLTFDEINNVNSGFRDLFYPKFDRDGNEIPFDETFVTLYNYIYSKIYGA